MDDVCSLLLSRPEKEVGVLGSSILLEVSNDVGQSILLRFFFVTIEDAVGIISARVANWANMALGISVLNIEPPNPTELRLGGHYLPSPVVCTLCGILDYVRIDANIINVVPKSIMLCNWLLDVVAIIGQPLEPIVRCLEYEPCGSAFVEKQLVHSVISIK